MFVPKSDFVAVYMPLFFFSRTTVSSLSLPLKRRCSEFCLKVGQLSSPALTHFPRWAACRCQSFPRARRKLLQFTRETLISNMPDGKDTELGKTSGTRWTCWRGGGLWGFFTWGYANSECFPFGSKVKRRSILQQGKHTVEAGYMQGWR